MLSQDRRCQDLSLAWFSAKSSVEFASKFTKEELAGSQVEFETQCKIAEFAKDLTEAINAEGYTAIIMVNPYTPHMIRTVGALSATGIQYYSPSSNAQRCYESCDIFSAVSFVVFKED